MSQKLTVCNLVTNSTENERDLHKDWHVRSVKFLGIFLDEEMKWKSHVNHIISKICKNIGIMGKLRDCLPQHILLLLYLPWYSHI